MLSLRVFYHPVGSAHTTLAANQPSYIPLNQTNIDYFGGTSRVSLRRILKLEEQTKGGHIYNQTDQSRLIDLHIKGPQKDTEVTSQMSYAGKPDRQGR